LFWDDEITPEEEEVLLHEIARRIWDYGMESAAMLFLETSKPFAYIGAQMGQVVLLPFLNFLGDDPLLRGDKYIRVLQKHDNVDKLLAILEYISIHEKLPELKLIEGNLISEKPPEEPSIEEVDTITEKKGWRRFFPF
jgi:hypothetical protein